MKKYIYIKLILGLFCFGWATHLQAQTGINGDNSFMDLSVMPDVQSQNSNYLMPRMTEDDRLAINTHSNGVFLFQTDNTSGGYNNPSTSSMPEWATVAMQTSTLICDRRIPIDSVFNGSNYIISESGSYYLTSNITLDPSNNFADGIRIQVSNVTLDLNGYTLNGSDVGDDGIVVTSDFDNIIIKNGIVEDWRGDGINAFSADQSIFMDLIVRNNDGDGLVGDFNCLIHRCVAEGNGFDGLETDDGGIISNSTAYNNGDNGIQTGDASLVINCTSYENAVDGFDLFSGSKIDNCNAYDNGTFGIDMGLGGQVINCMANENRGNGIDLASSCLAINNTANENGRCWTDGGGCTASIEDGAGIRAFANAQIINNTCNDNIMGIRISSTDSYASDNYVEGNRHAGLVATSSGCFIVRNRAVNNGFGPVQGLLDNGNDPAGNIVISANSAYGPIINVSSSGNLLNTPDADHTYANFEY